MNTAVLCVTTLIATLAFAWLAGGVLTAISWVVARMGSAVHRFLRLLPRNESDAWLFVLLIGVSRVPIIALAAGCFAGVLAHGLMQLPEIYTLLLGIAVQLLIIVLAMRLITIFVGSVVIGGSVRSLLKTLKS